MKRTRATTTAFGLALSLALALTAFASASAADGPAPTFELSLAPKPVVTAGETALARAELENVTGKPLAQVEITFDLPAGSFESASPEGRCVLKRTQVSCAIGKVPAGGVVEQFIMLTVPADVEEVAVAAEARFKKSGSGGLDYCVGLDGRGRGRGPRRQGHLRQRGRHARDRPGFRRGKPTIDERRVHGVPDPAMHPVRWVSRSQRPRTRDARKA